MERYKFFAVVLPLTRLATAPTTRTSFPQNFLVSLCQDRESNVLARGVLAKADFSTVRHRDWRPPRCVVHSEGRMIRRTSIGQLLAACIVVAVLFVFGTPQASAHAGPPDAVHAGHQGMDRSEERRVGKECRSRWAPYDEKKRGEKKGRG